MESNELINFFKKNIINVNLINNEKFKELIVQISDKISKLVENGCETIEKENHIVVGMPCVLNKNTKYYKIEVISKDTIEIIERNVTNSLNDSFRVNDLKSIIRNDSDNLIIEEYYEGTYLNLRMDPGKSNTDYIRQTKKYDNNAIEYERIQKKWYKENNQLNSCTDIISGASIDNIDSKTLKSDFSDPTYEEVKKIRMYPDVMRVLAKSSKYDKIDIYYQIPYLKGEKELASMDIGTDFANIDSLLKPIEKLSLEEYELMDNKPGMSKYMSARYGIDKDRIDFSYEIDDTPKFGM